MEIQAAGPLPVKSKEKWMEPRLLLFSPVLLLLDTVQNPLLREWSYPPRAGVSHSNEQSRRSPADFPRGKLDVENSLLSLSSQRLWVVLSRQLKTNQ